MRYEIRELALGEILDQAIAVLKDHWKLLLGITLVLQVPFFVVQGAVMLATAPQPPVDPTPEEMEAFLEATMSSTVVTLPIVLLGLFFVFPITNAAIIHGIAGAYLGKPVTVGQSFQRAFAIFLPLVWTWFLLYAAVTVGLMLCIIPGIIFSFWFFLATQVVVIEGTSGVGALKRSRELMRGNIGTLFVLWLVIAAINMGIGVAGAVIPQEHVQMIASVLAQAVASIFGAAAMVVFYFSCRSQHEHFDLTLLAQGVGAESPETPAGPGDPGAEGMRREDLLGPR